MWILKVEGCTRVGGLSGGGWSDRGRGVIY